MKKSNKLVKRMSNEQIFDYLCKGVKVPKLTRNELVKINYDILAGTETYLGMGGDSERSLRTVKDQSC